MKKEMEIKGYKQGIEEERERILKIDDGIIKELIEHFEDIDSFDIERIIRLYNYKLKQKIEGKEK